MAKFVAVVTAGLLAVLATAPVIGATRDGSPTATGPSDYVRDEVLITFRHGIAPRAERQEFASAWGLEEKSFEPVSGLFTYRIVDGSDVDSKMNALTSHPDVARLNRNWLGIPMFTPNDPYYSPEQWGLPKVRMPAAWDTLIADGEPGGSTEYLAVIDTGVDKDHPDLGNIYGWNFADNNNSFGDQSVCPIDADGGTINGHGSFVAGVAAAFTNNAKGIAGANYAAPILSARIYSASSLCVPSYNAAVEAIYYAVNNGASVITASWGFLRSDAQAPELKAAVTYAYNNDVLVVTGSGNFGWSDFSSIVPARWSKAVTVGGTNSTDHKPTWANYGLPGLDLSAPAQGIYSTNRSGSYGYVDGTSFAVPFVAGTIGLLKGNHPNISSAAIKQRLWNSADKVNSGTYNYYWRDFCGGQSQQLGCGRLDAAETVQ